MSAEQVSALMGAVLSDPELTQRFAALTKVEDAVALAAEMGFDVTADEVVAAAIELNSQELSDAELAGASGGTCSSISYSNAAVCCTAR